MTPSISSVLQGSVLCLLKHPSVLGLRVSSIKIPAQELGDISKGRFTGYCPKGRCQRRWGQPAGGWKGLGDREVPRWLFHQPSATWLVQGLRRMRNVRKLWPDRAPNRQMCDPGTACPLPSAPSLGATTSMATPVPHAHPANVLSPANSY